jgi:predicted nucleotidyltransferase
MNKELRALAEVMAQWVHAAPGITDIYLFGSRVRGDHRPNSDVDVRLYLDEWRHECGKTAQWWQDQNETDFAELKAKLPGPLAIHREKIDAADDNIRKGAKDPVLTVRKVVCVWTPPKSSNQSITGSACSSA